MRESCSTLGGQSACVHPAITSLPTACEGKGGERKTTGPNESKAVMSVAATTTQTAGMLAELKPCSKKGAGRTAQGLDKRRVERKVKFKRTHNLVAPMPVRHNILSPFSLMAKLPSISVSRA